MKTASIPSLRVDPELRKAAESVLRDGESLSSFVEHSIRAQIDRRQTRLEFIARGLASRTAAQSTGEYFSADEVISELDERLSRAEAHARSGR
jgi:predicted transcriptional regulator